MVSNIALRKAQRLFSRGAAEQAVDTLNAAIESGCKDPRLLLRRGLMTGSVEDLKKAGASGSLKRAVPFFIAREEYKNGDLDEAGRFAEEALDASPGNISARVLLALIEFRRGRAEPLFGMRSELVSATLEVQSLALLEVEKAIASIDTADTGASEKEDKLGGPAGWLMDRLDDAAVWIYWALSRFLNLLINITDARRREAYRHVSDGDLLEGLGRAGEAAAVFEKTLSVDPGNQEALESLTRYHLERGDFAKAAAYLDRLEKVSENGAGSEGLRLKWRGEILLRTGKTREAERVLAEAGRIRQLDYIIPYRRGLCLARLGADGEARRAFEESLGMINPGLLAERVDRLQSLSVS